jgi:hypothetical protein
MGERGHMGMSLARSWKDHAAAPPLNISQVLHEYMTTHDLLPLLDAPELTLASPLSLLLP